MSKTKMEGIFDTIMDVYHDYTELSKDKEPDTLDPAEFKKMVEEQFPHFLKNARDPKAVDKLFAEVDKNKDKKINFPECMELLSKFAILAHEKYHSEHEGGPHGHAHPGPPH